MTSKLASIESETVTPDAVAFLEGDDHVLIHIKKCSQQGEHQCSDAERSVGRTLGVIG